MKKGDVAQCLHFAAFLSNSSQSSPAHVVNRYPTHFVGKITFVTLLTTKV